MFRDHLRQLDMIDDQVSQYAEFELTPEQARRISALTYSIWPNDKSFDQRVAEILASIAQGAQADNLSTRRFVVWKGNTAVAHAKTFFRTVSFPSHALMVLALASVCTDPAVRGMGFGASVVRRAFEQVDRGVAPVSLFQTGVPEFYKKLGCRIVDNRFINLKNADAPDTNPWWDKHVMIYPASFDWPSGTIDLNGPGY